jgi:crotonobetaine/carnitine-CoA ligase
VRFGYAVRDLTIGQLLAAKALRNGDRTFLACLSDGRRYSYADVERASNAIARGLAAHGVRHGDHVALMLENCPEQILAYFALGKIGAVAVPLHAASRGRMLQYYLEHSDSVALVTSTDLLDRLPEHRPAALRRVFVVGAREAKAPRPLDDLPIVPFEDLECRSSDAFESPAKFSDLAFIKYTSGTTGPAKGVMMTQARTLLYGITTVESNALRDDDIFYNCLPCFHVAGLHGCIYAMLIADGAVALQRRFSVSGFWDDVRSSGATVATLLGAMANMLWALPASPDDRRHRLRRLQVAPVPGFARAIIDRYGVRLASGYGMTDYGIPMAFNPDDPEEKLGSTGRVRTGWSVKVVDDDDFEVPLGQVGEILIRSKYPWDASSGYYKMPAETLDALRNGWFHTGDRGCLDADGYLWFADRKKDSIRRRGENISAYEVEQIIRTHPAVLDVAAYPVQSSMSEEELAVSVVPRHGQALKEGALIDFCEKNMAGFMVPRFVALVDALPYTATHRVEKFKLRTCAEENPGRLWDRELNRCGPSR